MKITIALKMLRTRKGRAFVSQLLAAGYSLTVQGSR